MFMMFSKKVFGNICLGSVKNGFWGEMDVEENESGKRNKGFSHFIHSFI